MKVSNITLNYTCDDCDVDATQPLADITFVGTLICPECGEDMSLTESVTAVSTTTELIALINTLELTESESQDIARAALAKNSVPVTMWSVADIEAELTERAENHYEREFTEEERAKIVNHVLASRTWRTTITESTEDHWTLIDDEIDTAVFAL